MSQETNTEGLLLGKEEAGTRLQGHPPAWQRSPRGGEPHSTAPRRVLTDLLLVTGVISSMTLDSVVEIMIQIWI